MRTEAAVAPNTIATIGGLDDLHAHSVFTALGSSDCQVRESTIRAMRSSNIAVGRIAFVEHDSILAALATAIFGFAHALGLVVVVVRRLPPNVSGFANESIYNALAMPELG
jgi:hypothetical protein